MRELEEYRRRLYDFETDFVFSYVTEVPQYQELYDRVAQSFALRRLFEDVHEPLNSLADVRREAAEEEQEKRELGVNRALLILAVLWISNSFTPASTESEGIRWRKPSNVPMSLLHTSRSRWIETCLERKLRLPYSGMKTMEKTRACW